MCVLCSGEVRQWQLKGWCIHSENQEHGLALVPELLVETANCLGVVQKAQWRR